MNKDEVLLTLKRLKPEMVKKFGVTSLSLFGSAARDEIRPDSDIDIVVTFDSPTSSKSYFGVQFLLEDTFNRTIDLVTDKAIRKELRPYIERESIRV